AFALVACGQTATVTGDALKASLARQDLGTKPLLLADVAELGVAATLQIGDRDRGITAWQTADGVTLSFRNGIVTATRGLPEDLMVSDTTAVARAVRTGGASYNRINDYIGGEDQTIRVVFECTQTGRNRETLATLRAQVTVTKVTETCRTSAQSIENTYWIGGDGIMWKSQQWVSPLVGYLKTERLVR
ncbi:MAG: YjbF family lipoprotein, partial [Pseudomonadota bacterium]